MTKQESYKKAYCPMYGAEAFIISAQMTHFCEWLYNVVIKTDECIIVTTLAEKQLENFRNE